MHRKRPSQHVLECGHTAGYFSAVPRFNRLTYYADCVNIYAECVSHQFLRRSSRLFVRRFWRRRCSLLESPGIYQNWRCTSGLRRPAFSGSSMLSPKAAFCGAGRKVGAPTIAPRPPLRFSRNSAPCSPKRPESYLCSNPNLVTSPIASSGRLFTDRLQVVRSNRKATSICW